jgi:hyperosmotically inducible protein
MADAGSLFVFQEENAMRDMTQKLSFVALAAVLAFGASGCQKSPAVDEHLSEAGKEMKEAGHDVAQAGEKVGDAAAVAGQDASQAAQEAGDRAAVATDEAGQKIAAGAERAAESVSAGTERAAESVAAGTERAAEAAGDASISSKVKAKLLADPEVKGVDIDVDTANAVVTLTGTAKTRALAAEAVKLARHTEGVKSVVDNIKVTG